MLDKRRNRAQKCRTRLDGLPTAYTLIDVPCSDLNAFAGRPRFDRRALGFGAKPLLLLGHADVGHCDAGITGFGHALRHIDTVTHRPVCYK